MSPRDLCLAVLVAALWGCNFVAAKLAMHDIPPLMTTGLRFVLVAALLLPFQRFPRGQFWPLVRVGMVLGVFHFGVLFWALRTVDAGSAAIVIQLQVPLGTLLAAILLGERVTRLQVFGIIVAFGGLVVVLGAPALADKPFEVALLLSAAFAFAFASIQSKQLASLPPFTQTAWLGAIAGPVLVALSLVLEQDAIARTVAAHWSSWGGFAYTVCASTLAGYGLWYTLLARNRVSHLMPFMLLVPVFAVLSGIAVLGEKLHVQIVVGGVLVLAGVALVVLRKAAPVPTLAEAD
ncbi:DMT family transporter [Roseiterribacter gracilis]|uniref:Membrane protein n=1 Tax=Roseiterribacter gracilis TaxID=2812848 RepID=A0A8S8XD12_9PROT|nr:membrane protein [Rhodospirillales bacterium TMPK1]